MKKIVALLGMAAVSVLPADDLLLSNGKSIHGEIVTVDQYFVRVRSASGEEVSYPRSKVQGIRFVSSSAAPNRSNAEQAAAAATEALGSVIGGTAVDSNSGKKLSVEDFLRAMPRSPDAEIRRMESMFGVTAKDREQTPAEVVRALRYKGSVNREILNEVFRTFPLLENPAAKQYFDGTLEGLISGEKSLAELRADAIDARRKLAEMERFVGPGNDAMFRNYADVLDRFIQQSAEP